MAIFNISATIPSFGDIQNSIPIGVSPLGTPVYDDVTILAGSYVDQSGNTINYDTLQLQSVQLTVNQSKNIIETSVSGRNGTIKEYISQGDYEVSINAKITELFNVFPYDQLEKFNNIVKSTSTIQITCRFLNEIFGINTFVVRDFSCSNIPGSINEADLTMRLSSDEPFDINQFIL